MGNKVIPVCRRCGNPPRGGFRSGFRLRGGFFCAECAQDLLTTFPGQPDYQEFMAVVRATLARSSPPLWVR